MKKMLTSNIYPMPNNMKNTETFIQVIGMENGQLQFSTEVKFCFLSKTFDQLNLKEC